MRNPEKLTTKEAAECLGFSEESLKKWRKRSEGPGYYKMMGSIYYTQSDLDKFKASCKVATNE